ncbi:MAG: hypothetical protein LBJ88_01170 [Campylobacteraceae bacterium]|jgi:hypothetical protein|nr:hypothetical protein [Campylobacteraceae bacterium]
MHKEQIEIIPLNSAGKFKLNEKREIILPKIDFKLRTTREDTFEDNKFIIDDYAEALAYYNQENEKLFYVLFAPLPSYKLIFSNQDLFKLNAQELFDFLNKSDNDLHIEDYVGFGSTKFGLDIYAPNFTDDPTSSVEAISFAIKGYFDAIYACKHLDINKLQKM